MLYRIISWIVTILIIIFLLKWFERKNVYFPTRSFIATPEDIGLPYREVYFNSEDNIKLHGWFIPSNSNKCLLFCHGNGGNISHRIESISLFHSMGLNVFIFDYRAYGKSQGIATEKGTYMDALGAYSYLLEKNIEPEHIIIFGRSLGGNIAIDLATRVKEGILIVEGTFTSTMDLSRNIYGIRIPARILSFKYNAIRKIADVSIPTAIIHSEDDEMIPFEHGMRLFNAANEPKEFVILKGTHNIAFITNVKKYREKLEEFIKKYID